MRILTSTIDGEPIAYHYTGAEVRAEREGPDLTEEALQTSAKRLAAGRTFGAHAHLPITRITATTQEAWIVVTGLVRVTLFDLDDSKLATCELGPGDSLVTFRGGHSMVVLEDTLLYEVKNGPYRGQAKDKRWLP